MCVIQVRKSASQTPDIFTRVKRSLCLSLPLFCSSLCISVSTPALLTKYDGYFIVGVCLSTLFSLLLRLFHSLSVCFWVYLSLSTNLAYYVISEQFFSFCLSVSSLSFLFLFPWIERIFGKTFLKFFLKNEKSIQIFRPSLKVCEHLRFSCAILKYNAVLRIWLCNKNSLKKLT